VAELQEQATNFAEVYPNYDPEKLNDLDLHKPYIDEVKLKCGKCEVAGRSQATMTRIPEVVDCWVESASMPFAELHAPFENQELFTQRMPADFLFRNYFQNSAVFILTLHYNDVIATQIEVDVCSLLHVSCLCAFLRQT
jgi:isoleucyl-tRNA synthetase